MREEVWKKIVIDNEITKYSVSNYGRVRNDQRIGNKKGGILQGRVQQNGYWAYNLSLKHKTQNYMGHRLVAEAFIPTNDKTLHVNHKDRNKANNCVNNLEWVTPSENTRHYYDTGGKAHSKPVSAYTLGGRFIKKFSSHDEAYEFFGVPKSNRAAISMAKKRGWSMELQWREEGDDTPVKDIRKSIKVSSIGVLQIDNGKVINTFNTMQEAYDYLNVRANGLISQVCKGNRKTAFGYKWAYCKCFI